MCVCPEVNEFVVGQQGGKTITLADLSNAQLINIYRNIFKKAPIVQKRALIINSIEGAITKGVNIRCTVASYVWCEADKGYPKRIAFWVCRRKQVQGECSLRACEQSTRDQRQKRRVTMTKAEEKPGKISKIDLLKTAFGEKKTWTVAELTERTGYDEKNLYVAVKFLQNPKRTKADQLMVIEYDKKEKTYTLA